MEKQQRKREKKSFMLKLGHIKQQQITVFWEKMVEWMMMVEKVFYSYLQAPLSEVMGQNGK